MRTMPSMDYMGYAVVVNALPAPNNRFYSVFAIRRHARNSMLNEPPVAYQEGVSSAVTCPTMELALQSASDRARTWIDAHPVR